MKQWLTIDDIREMIDPANPEHWAFYNYMRQEVLPCIREHGTYPAPVEAHNGIADVPHMRNINGTIMLKPKEYWVNFPCGPWSSD